jgi:hypothetical protein
MTTTKTTTATTITTNNKKHTLPMVPDSDVDMEVLSLVLLLLRQDELILHLERVPRAVRH